MVWINLIIYNKLMVGPWTILYDELEISSFKYSLMDIVLLNLGKPRLFFYYQISFSKMLNAL
jgi:hypothetical protein